MESEPDELDSRNSNNIVREDLGTVWHEDGGSPGGYRDNIKSPRVTKKYLGPLLNFSAQTQNRSAYAKSELREQSQKLQNNTLNRNERLTNSSNETSYRSIRK